MLALALLALCADPLTVAFDTLDVGRARTLHGQPVTVSLLVAKPSYTWSGRTVIGAADAGDAVERNATLRGHRWGVEEGKRFTVRGVLRVIDHPATFVGGEFVPQWVEIRVEERP
jgi:hypothetical protein